MLNYLSYEKRELDSALAWLSTLGGAFSALGDDFENCVSWIMIFLLLQNVICERFVTCTEKLGANRTSPSLFLLMLKIERNELCFTTIRWIFDEIFCYFHFELIEWVKVYLNSFILFALSISALIFFNPQSQCE